MVVRDVWVVMIIGCLECGLTSEVAGDAYNDEVPALHAATELKLSPRYEANNLYEVEVFKVLVNL